MLRNEKAREAMGQGMTNPTVANGGDPELVAKAQAALQQLFNSTRLGVTLPHSTSKRLIEVCLQRRRAYRSNVPDRVADANGGKVR